MNLNIEKFYKSFPTMGHNRNRFPWEKGINFNMKMGEITPIAVIRTVPGCTYNLDISTVIKVAPLQEPPQDDAIFKAFAFNTPDRITWTNYPYWFGELQDPEHPEEEPTYLMPKVIFPKGGFEYNGYYDNIGCPPEVGNYKIDRVLPNGDRQIYNNYFRNQSLENSLEIIKDDRDIDFNDENAEDLIKTYNRELRKICKPRDYFTQGLPTQSGTEPVEIPLGSYAPIISDGSPISLLINGNTTGSNLKSIGSKDYNDRNTLALTSQASKAGDVLYNNAGLQADLTKAIGAPLEGLYQAIAYNTMQYITSRGGNRYFERLSNIYGCVNPEGTLQIPEFLGSVSQYIEFDTVTQTSATNGEVTPLAHRAANGYMESYGNLINKSFGEFGWIHIYGVVTYHMKYQQGISKLMDVNDPLDLFNPIFNLMGDEAILNKEIYVQDNDVVDENGNVVNDKVWAYGKRNAPLLYPINEIHGEQRSSYSQSLDTNHFAQYFAELPNLTKEFDKVTDEGFKRCLQFTDETQFICNSLITGTIDVEIPTNAIPSPIPQQILNN